MYIDFQHRLLLAKWLLRAGLAFVFMYAAIEILFNPTTFLVYLPDVVKSVTSPMVFLMFFSVAEITLAAWLLSGWRAQYAALTSFAVITGIVVFNLDYIAILFRNVAISFGALALAELERIGINKNDTKKDEQVS